MSAIQPSIVARLKPELVPVRTRREINEQGRATGVFYWQPLEYKDQILDLQPDEDATPCQTADLGGVMAVVIARTYSRLNDFAEVKIYVQFHHTITP